MNNLRPKLSDIITRIENDATSRLTSEELRRSDLSVFIRVIAGVSHSIYAALDYYKISCFLIQLKLLILKGELLFLI